MESTPFDPPIPRKTGDRHIARHAHRRDRPQKIDIYNKIQIETGIYGKSIEIQNAQAIYSNR